MCCAIALQLEAFLNVAVGVASRAHACLNNHEGPPLTLGASACGANRKMISKISENFGFHQSIQQNVAILMLLHVMKLSPTLNM